MGGYARPVGAWAEMEYGGYVQRNSLADFLTDCGRFEHSEWKDLC